MLRHVQHAVDGTFFDRWLSYVRETEGGGGWASLTGAGLVVSAQAEGKEGGPGGGGHGPGGYGGPGGLGGGAGQLGAASASTALSEAARRFMACEHDRDDEGDDDEHEQQHGHDGCSGGGGSVGGKKGGGGACDPRRRANCQMCHWVGRCPRESKLEPQEFEEAVRAIAKDASLGMADKSRAVQMLRSCSWRQLQQLGPLLAAQAHAQAQAQAQAQAGGKRPRSPAGGAMPGAPLPSQQRLLAPSSAPAAAPGKEEGGGGRVSAAVAAAGAAAGAGAGAGAQQRKAAAVNGECGGGDGRGVTCYTPTGELGCRHYRRACTLKAECCGRFFPCRLCHDEATADHAMDRYAVKEICCMRCGEVQPAAQYCRSEACRARGQPLSAYYCGICRLYDDDAGKAIYHCPYCNVCRLGKGLGVDFRHCMTCNACVSLAVPSERHKCIEQALQRDCPVCNEPLFTSTTHYKVGRSVSWSCMRLLVRGVLLLIRLWSIIDLPTQTRTPIHP